MKAVLIEVDVAGVDETVGISAMRERIVPTISSMPGFMSGIWLTGGTADRGLSLTVWNDAERAQAFADRFGPGGNPTVGATVTRCELRDVAATA